MPPNIRRTRITDTPILRREETVPLNLGNVVFILD
jgi:hypothetical protein